MGFLDNKPINGSFNTNPQGFLIITIFFFILITLFSPIISADIISVNAGGGNETAVTDKYIEGFFSGITGAVVSVPVCGNSIIETGETCDDGNIVSGDGCSSACQTEVPGGGETPGGGGGAAVTPTKITLFPTEFNINLAIDTTAERTIKVTNNGTSSVTVGVSKSTLESHVILENTTLTIPAGQTVDFKVIFVALSEPGIFTGTINIGGKTVLVSLNVKTKLLLFDSNLVVLNKNYQVQQGDELKTKVTLIPLGDPERLDVTLLFTIRDYSGKIYLTKSETLLVDKLTELNRNFDTGTLPSGKYVVGLELRYPNGVAPSSAHFEVLEKKGTSIISRIIMYLISLILLILIILLIILIWKRLKKKIEENAGEAA
ncbi:MAG: myxococcus cysteine-rich repeat containing protein [Candidatus Pacearchaeota archaeon]|nr:myxococcus cysteine-rich repeat containing protein [Candidatus Pacearchaeota archaeon]